jgi:predicted nucleic acid-binding protein
MKGFLDTSVLIAAFWGDHENHETSLSLLEQARKENWSCGIHSLAEVYAVMTALPVRPILAPDQVALFVEQIPERLSVVSLDETEYRRAIQDAADRGMVSGRIYDALLLACARKARARTIYTWNLKHFRQIAPDLAERIRTP